MPEGAENIAEEGQPDVASHSSPQISSPWNNELTVSVDVLQTQFNSVSFE